MSRVSNLFISGVSRGNYILNYILDFLLNYSFNDLFIYLFIYFLLLQVETGWIMMIPNGSL